MSKWTFFNTDFVKEADTVLHFRDLSVQRGYGIFDFLKVVNGHPVFLKEHLNRFYFSAKEMRLEMNYSTGQLQEIIFDLLKKNESNNTGVKIILTGGYSPDGYHIATPNLIIALQSFTPPSKEQFDKGIRLITYAHQRQLPHIKTIDYLMPVWLQPILQQHHADDVLYHQNGIISECPRSNIFIVSKENKLLTPSCNILKGIVRNKLIEATKKEFEIEEKNITINEVKAAKEVFITSTTKTILRVNQIDEKVLNSSSKAVTPCLFQIVHQKMLAQ